MADDGAQREAYCGRYELALPIATRARHSPAPRTRAYSDKRVLTRSRDDQFAAVAPSGTSAFQFDPGPR
jgi:hypothetical protein